MRDRENARALTRAWKAGHRDRVRQSNRESARRHPGPKRKAYRRWRTKHIEQERARNRAWAAANRDKRRAADRRKREKVKADPVKWAAFKLSNLIRLAIRSRLGRKTSRTRELLGCSIVDFRAHIERQWQPGMSWANYGSCKDNWQFDHVRPVASFDLSDPVQQRACFHFSNYQPLWKLDNVRKGARWAA